MREQHITFVGASAATSIQALDPQAGIYSFFQGPDAKRWAAGLHAFARLEYKQIYPGIDLTFYGHNGRLEYDFTASPGANPSLIQLRIGGDATPKLGDHGELYLGDDALSTVHTPLMYQNLPHGKRVVEGRFVSVDRNTVRFAFRAYDKTKPFVIDPTITLLYGTYIGGKADDKAVGLTMDAAGNSYVYGYSFSEDFPVSSNAYQTSRSQPEVYNLTLTKFDPSGNLLFSTYLHGSGGDYACYAAPTTRYTQDNQPCGVVVDAQGNAYITGNTQSQDFPVTTNAFQSTFQGSNPNAFVSEISSDGTSLLYSTYLSGSGGAAGVDLALVPNEHRIYFLGTAGSGFPTTSGAYMPTLVSSGGNQGAVIAELDLDQSGASQLIASTYYGSTAPQSNGIFVGFAPSRMKMNSAGALWIAGSAFTSGLPTTANAIQPSIPALSGNCDGYGAALNSAAFVFQLSPDLSTLNYASYLSGLKTGSNVNGCSEVLYTMVLDSSDNIFVAGNTASASFPTTSNAIQPTNPGNGSYIGYLAKLSADGTKLLYGSYLGGQGGAGISALATDAGGDIWIAGGTGGGSNFPITPGAFQTAIKGGEDGYITELSSDGSSLLYSTFIGGSGTDTILGLQVDTLGNVHVDGFTNSADFPLSANALQSNFANGEAINGYNDEFFAILGGGTVGSYGPLVGGNMGDTTLTVNGAGFVQGASCELVSGTTVVTSSNSAVSPNGTAIACTFPLSGAAIGSYQVIVLNPNGSTLTASTPFTIQNASGPNVWITITGRSKIRGGVPATYTVSYGNSGGTDAIAVPIQLTLPAGVTATLPGGTATIPFPSDLSPTVAPLLYQDGAGNNVLPLMVPRLAAGESSSFVVAIPYAPSAPSSISGQIFVGPAVATSQSSFVDGLNEALGSPSLNDAPLSVQWGNCLLNAIPTAVTLLDPEISLAKQCVQSSVQLIGSIVSSLDEPQEPGPSQLIPVGGLLTTAAQAGLNCSALLIDAEPEILIPATAVNLISGFFGVVGTYQSCRQAYASQSLSEITSQVVSSIDPNDKSGPSGDGSVNQYVKGTVPLTYNIAFENHATASAPASQVMVSDQLDLTKLDPSSVTLGPMQFGATLVQVPSGVSNYNTVQSISSSLSVRIQGSINPSTGLLKWTFTSIDPSTGLPPTDPTIGFLPPDIDGVEGEANVTVDVMPLAGLTTGTQITNAASVTFDANAPLATQTWLNTLDVDPPVSAVSAPSFINGAGGSANIPLTWTGTDKGSGIATYSIFVSDNGGAFTPFEIGVATTSAMYPGQTGHTYGFYSIAVDGAGNVETSKTTADATTVVTALTGTTSTLSASATTLAAGSSLTLTAVVVSASGSGTPTGTITFMDGGTTTLGSAALASGTASFTTNALAVGSHAVMAVYGGDSNFSSSTSAAVTITVSAAPPDFAVTLSPSSGTITGSGSASTTVSVAPSGNFNDAVALSCTGLPSYSTCSFSPASVTPASTASFSSTLTITVDTASAALDRYRGFGTTLAIVPLGSLLGLLLLRPRRGVSLLFVLVSFVSIATLLQGCSSPGGASTPKGTYNVSVTATSGSTIHTAAFSLTVQ